MAANLGNIVGVWRNSTNQFEEYEAYIYDDGWVPVLPYVYSDGAWRRIGGAGTLMVPFVTSTGDYFYTSDGKLFQVRNHE